MPSSQLTVQELSVMMRHGLNPIIFVLNNSGYTIERFIHGMNAKYNDIRNWYVRSDMLVCRPLVLMSVSQGVDQDPEDIRRSRRQDVPAVHRAHQDGALAAP